MQNLIANRSIVADFHSEIFFLVVTDSELFFSYLGTPIKVPRWSPTLFGKMFFWHFFSTFFFFYLPAYLPTCLPTTYLPTCLPTTYLPTYLLPTYHYAAPTIPLYIFYISILGFKMGIKIIIFQFSTLSINYFTIPIAFSM